MTTTLTDLEQNYINRNIKGNQGFKSIHEINLILKLVWTDEKEINSRIEGLKILLKNLEGLNSKVEKERKILLNLLCDKINEK